MKVFILSHQNGIPQQNNFYRFRGMEKIISWPICGGAFLGEVGVWNFLFRLGMNPEYLMPKATASLVKGDLLFVIAEREVLEKDVCERIDRYLADGVVVIAGGPLSAWQWLLPVAAVAEQASSVNSYAAFGWKFGDTPAELIAPPLWPYSRLINREDICTYGQLVVIGGERQTPQRAVITELPDSPAVIRHKNFIFLNGNPFAAFQAWLQGQEDLSPWLQWRHRLFWLDEQAAFLLKILNEYALKPSQIIPRPLPGLSETVVVLRHDLDHSRDTAYLEIEQEAKVPGVHAVLKDNNTGFWIKTLGKLADHETSFHYATAQYNKWLEWLRSKFGLKKRSLVPKRRLIAGAGLLRQVQWAKRRGIGIKTIHRHQSFLIYPEWVDALHNVFENEPDVLGASSLFRGQLLRWGSDRADGMHGAYGVFPDAQFPYWFPCKLAHAGLGGKPLRGWETASVMEIEPELFKQMLDYRVPGIPQKIITINYHPSHARRSTFCNGGSLLWWKDILRIIRQRGIGVMTLSDLYALMDKAIEK
jgi:hypothetical protein